jgi:hypothetical protein
MVGLLLGILLVDGLMLNDGISLGVLVGLSVMTMTEPLSGLEGVTNKTDKLYQPPEGSV